MTYIIGGPPNGLRTCRGCGCDDDHACITDDGPCAWALLDVDSPTPIPTTLSRRYSSLTVYTKNSISKNKINIPLNGPRLLSSRPLHRQPCGSFDRPGASEFARLVPSWEAKNWPKNWPASHRL